VSDYNLSKLHNVKPFFNERVVAKYNQYDVDVLVIINHSRRMLSKVLKTALFSVFFTKKVEKCSIPVVMELRITVVISCVVLLCFVYGAIV